MELITHCAWLLELPLGICKVLPAGHVVAPGAAAGDGAGAAPALEILAPDMAISPTAADTIAAFRTRCCLNLCEIRTVLLNAS